MKTVNEMVVFWNHDDGQIEIPGIYFYGYWGGEAIPSTVSKIAEAWRSVESEIVFRQIEAEDGNFLVVTIWVKSWPTDPIWRSAIEETLTGMISTGAKVAWCGGETCSWSLAELDPDSYSGCIYAASSPRQQPILHSEISSKDLVFLSESDISELGVVSHGH